MKNKKEKSTNWNKKAGKHETVMFVEMTEKSELKKEVEIAAKRNKIKIKVQERPGTKLNRILQRSDPFSKKKCNRKDCVIAQNTGNTYMLVVIDKLSRFPKVVKVRGMVWFGMVCTTLPEPLVPELNLHTSLL